MSTTAAAPASARDAFIWPAIFVLFWSSGPVATKVGLGYSEPFTFLALRFGLLSVVLLPLFVRRRPEGRPSLAAVAHAAVAGLLIQVVFLGTAFTAIKLGVSAGLSALITGLQPLVTVVLAAVLLGERVTGRKAAGILIGFLGLSLFVWGQLSIKTVRIELVLVHLVGLIAIAGGMVYQRRFGQKIDVLTNTAIQYIVAAAVFVPAALLLESTDVQWTPEFIAALLWMVLILSLAATSLLIFMINRQQAGKVSSLFYLMPPTAAILAFLILGERLSLPAIIGLGVATVGVAIIIKTPAASAGKART